MKKRFLRALSIIITVSLLCVPCSTLFASAAVSYYTDTIYTLSQDGARDIISLIESQTFTSVSVNKVCDFMYYFMMESPFAAVGGGKFPYPNTASYATYVTDGRYGVNIVGASGCLAYTRWVCKLIYGDDGYYSRTYLTHGGGVTAEAAEEFITVNLQAGEHIRFDNAPHSITFIAADSNGFYCMDYWSNPGGILLHYTTFEQFAYKCNAVGGDVFIYEADKAKNTVASYTVEPELLCGITNGANLAAENCYVGETAHLVYGLFDGGSGRYLDIRNRLDYTVKAVVTAPDGTQVAGGSFKTDGEMLSFIPKTAGTYKAAVTAEGSFPGGKVAETVSFNVTKGSSSTDGSLSSGSTGITLSLSDLTLAMGLSSRLFASLPNGAKLSGWKSSDSQVASVSQDGTVTALKPGSAVITVSAASSAGKAIKAECPVKVRGDAVAGDIDLDGIITQADLNYINSYLAGKIKLSDEQLFRADADGNGKINSTDANEIKSYVNYTSMWMSGDNIFSAIAVSSTPSKTKYAYGETLDTSGLKLAAIFENDVSYTISSGYTISGYNPLITGEQQVNVSYGPYIVPFTVTVSGKVNSVSYDVNDGFIAPASSAVPGNGKVTVTSVIPQKAGYDFKGWSLTSSGSAKYQPSSTFTATGSVTLYASWSKKTYTVSFDLNGGDGSFNDIKKEFGSSLIFSSNIPTRSGSTFLGWATEKNAQKPEYKPGDALYTNSNLTLYAIWEGGCAGHISCWRVAVASTETAQGVAEEYCSRCGELLGGKKSIPVLSQCKLTEKDDSALVRDEESGAIIVTSGTADDIISRFTNTLKIDVLDANGNKLKNGTLVTGCKVCLLTDYGMVLDSNVISVKGDIDSDGATTSADARLALRASVGLEKLTGAFIPAADVDGTKGVSSSDARLILRVSVGIDKLS